MKKAQAALEFIIIIAFALVILTPILINARDLSSDLVESSRIATAKDTINKLKNAAEFINAQGYPSRMVIKLSIPQAVNKTTLINQELSIDLETSKGIRKIYAVVDFNVSGTLPTSQGTYNFLVKKEVDYVNITNLS